MRKSFLGICVLLAVVFCLPANAQISNATVSGTVEDATRAVLPGVTITATNTATGVVTTAVSNESGVYNLPGLLPGPYKLTAQLPGFQTRTYEATLGNAQTVRLNFTLVVAGGGTAVEVSVAVDTLLATSSASIGEVLTQDKIKDLPLVGNNALFLVNTLAGTRMDDNGVTGTFAGMTNYNVNVQRDGIDASASARYMQAGIQTATMMSPDLIGEIRLIVAPVDAEMGRGNGQMIVQTKSGTNQYKGSALWSVRNSALDANTWSNNRQGIPPDWNNRHQYTLSLGGPIIKNRTFFFGLWDGLLNNRRTVQNVQTLTPCARNGIFRYWDTGSASAANLWNNGNAITPTSLGSTPTIAVVDAAGNLVRPATNPDGTAFNGTLRYASVFGRLPASLPAANADCSNISALVQAGTSWDTLRTGRDSTGFVTKLLGKVPDPNNYELGDGLNTAGFRWIRREKGGNENLFGFADSGLFGGIDRKQANGKVDHNFNNKNKVAVSYTYERDDGLANLATLPDTFGGSTYRRPQTLSTNLVSTLSPSLVNEFRSGFRRTSGNTFNALYDPAISQQAKAFYPNVSGIPVWIGLGTATNSQINFQATQPLGNGTTSSYQDVTKLWSFADTISWTRGKHSFKAGGEMRRQYSYANDTGVGTTAVPRALGGDASGAPISTGAISTTNMPGLAGTAVTGNNARMRQLLSMLAGSLSSITQAFYMQNPTKLDAFEDYRTFPSRIRKYSENEFSFFVKDDWKATNNLTLNLGLRYDWFGSPYEANGLMPLPVGGGYSIFGISGRSFDGWMSPGVRGESTTLQFVGKNSPHPDIPWYPNTWKNFGPAIGFAYQVPWFGAGKTTVRGGYQLTYQIGESFNNLFQEQNVPGSIYNATYTGDSTNTYLDLTKLNSVIPLPVATKPMQPISITERSQSLYVPDPKLVIPYAQNITLAITRSLTSKISLDLRYVGTLARKQRSAANDINIPNFLSNGLKEAFDAARSGNESTLLDSMLKGVNLGAGTVGSAITGAAALRADNRFNTNLANGNYRALAASLNTLNYASNLNPGLPTFGANIQGTVMRVNNFPENFIVTNPQFATINWITNNASNNYHSFNAQVTVRPARGVNWQSTYTWSKNLGINGLIGGGLGTTFTNPRDQHKDYAILPDTRIHDFRTSGTVELPFGPGKMLLRNSSGVLARFVEGWQTSWIVNLNTGQPLSIAAQSMLYANGTPDLVGPFDVRSGNVQFTGGPTGSYFSRDSIKQVADPQCSSLAANLKTLCSLSAIQDVKSGQILLQNPLPGTRGTLAQRAIEGPGRWRFDASLAKTIKLAETKSLQFRMDAQNVLNHPEPQTAVGGASLLNLDINNTSFGLITGPLAKTNLNRQFQAQLRLNF